MVFSGALCGFNEVSRRTSRTDICGPSLWRITLDQAGNGKSTSCSQTSGNASKLRRSNTCSRSDAVYQIWSR